MTEPISGNRQNDHGYSLIEVMIVVIIVMVIAGMAIPKVVTLAQNLRAGGDARDLNGTILVAKMRASSRYAQARLHADMNTQTFWIEVQPAGSASWTMEGGTQYLSKDMTFGYGSVSSPPSNTQSSLAQAPACPGFSNSACIKFNSRGIPVDNSNAPYGNYAIYVTNPISVWGVTVSITGVTQIWRADSSSSWTSR